jgi:hypothetical protein
VLKGVNQERYTVKVISLSKDKSEGEGVIQKIEEWKSYKIPFLKIGSCWTLKSKPEQVVIISFDYNHGKMAIVQ